MSVKEHCKGIEFYDMTLTFAFRSADLAWPFESWDNKEWDRVVKEVIKERKNGKV